MEIALRARGLKAKLSPLVEIIVAVGTSLVLWFGARMVLAGALSAGSLIVFILYLGKMYKPMQELSKMTDAYSKAAVGYERIREVLETERRGGGSAGRAARRRGSRAPSNSSTSTFSYEPGLAGAPRRELAHRAGTDGGAGGSHRGREDHHRQPDSPLLRSGYPAR